MALRVLAGIASVPVVAPVIAVTNLFDLICTNFKHLGLSIGHNINSSFNLLGDNGVFGPRKEYKDDRHLAVRIIYGILTIPLVIPTIAVTNLTDLVLSTFKHIGLSIGHNIKSSFNGILGEHGIFGPRIADTDDRHLAVRILAGIASTPVVFPSIVITNAIDIVGTALKHTILNKKFWMIAGGTVAATVLGPIGFCLRKTVRGLFNFTIRPIVEAAQGKDFNGKTFVSGLANFATAGLFGLAKKIFKGATGYTKRFGFPDKLDATEKSDYGSAMQLFRDGINLAAKGKFPGTQDGPGIFRPVMRLCFHVRHTSEKILKEFHNKYLEYIAACQKDPQASDQNYYSLHSFFKSNYYTQADQNARQGIAKSEGEKNIVDLVEQYLNPIPATA
jgi:hypothetical protein